MMTRLQKVRTINRLLRYLCDQAQRFVFWYFGLEPAQLGDSQTIYVMTRSRS